MRPTPEQINAMAIEYCRVRFSQEGKERNWKEYIEQAQIMSAWFMAWEKAKETK